MKEIVIIGKPNTIDFLRIDKIKTGERVTENSSKDHQHEHFSEKKPDHAIL